MDNTKHMKKKLPLLMTASVCTRGMINADFTAAEREKMYVEALTFYIEHLLRKTVIRQ